MNDILMEISKKYGTPSFVYHFDKIRYRVSEIEKAFENRFKISFAVKANPNEAILNRLKGYIPYLDVSSAGELKKSLQAGWKSSQISFTGPGKTDEELQFAIMNDIGEIVIESTNEAKRLNRFALNKGQKQDILIRISPKNVPKGFGGHMAGRPSAFGIDEEDLEESIDIIKALDGLNLIGFHLFSGTQCLNEKSIIENWQIFIEVFKEAVKFSGIEPQKLIFGSGMGIPYHVNETEIELNAVSIKANEMLMDLKKQEAFKDTSFVLETGRYIIGDAGVYLTRIVNKKISRGTTICICDGGMNHNLAACGLLGMIMPKNYKIIKVGADDPHAEYKEIQLSGPLCTSLDTFGRNVQIKAPEVGDVIGILGTGAYGLTSSPHTFISHELPNEILVEKSGKKYNCTLIS